MHIAIVIDHIGATESYLTHLVRSGDCLDDVGEVDGAGGEVLDMLSVKPVGGKSEMMIILNTILKLFMDRMKQTI